MHGPAYSDLDFSIFKRFRTTETTNLEFRAEFFNFLNHPNFGFSGAANSGLVSNNYNNSTFGIINSTLGTGRETQLALKFYF